MVAAKRGNFVIFEALLNFGAEVIERDLLDRDCEKLLEKFC